jgi:hypothetical protein
LCGNYYKNEEPAPTPVPTLTLDLTNIQRVLLGNVAQSLGSASVTTSLPSTVGTVYSLVDPIPEGFSINSSTGELSFTGSIPNYGNIQTLPDTVIIKASLNPETQRDVQVWHGNAGAVLEEPIVLGKENWNEEVTGYFYNEDKNTLLEMKAGTQNVDPSKSPKKTRTLCSTMYDDQGQATTINGRTRGVSGLETMVSSIPVMNERTTTMRGTQRLVSGGDEFFSYDITNKESDVDFSLKIMDDNQFTLRYDRNTERSEFNINGSIDQTTGTVSSGTTLDLTLNTIGQSTKYMGRGMWNPYITLPGDQTPFRESVDPGEIYTMFSDRYGTNRPPSNTPITYNESARINFDYGWTWGIGNFQPATYLPPLNEEFSRIFDNRDVPKNCELYPNANNFALGGYSFLAAESTPEQDPPQPTLYGGSSDDVPYRDPMMIRVYNFKRTDDKISTPIRIPGRCEYLPTLPNSLCGAEYIDGPLKCETTELLTQLQSRSSGLPNFNSLIQYILDGAGDDDARNEEFQFPEYEIIDVPNGAVAIVLSTKFRESQGGPPPKPDVNNAPPAKFYVYLAKLDSHGNPSSTVLNPSTDNYYSSAEQPQTITTGDECNFRQDFMGYTLTEYEESWGEVVVNKDEDNVITASYSNKYKYGEDDIYTTTEKGTMYVGLTF